MIGKTMMFNPFTGWPRRPEDIESDPAGILVWDGEEPLRSAVPAQAPAAEWLEREREAFEAWVKGQGLALCAVWNGFEYLSDGEPNGVIHMTTLTTRQKWYAWTARAALAATPAPQAVPADAQWLLHMAQEELKHPDPWPPVGAQAVAVAAASSAPAEQGEVERLRQIERGEVIQRLEDHLAWFKARAAPPAAQPAEPQRVGLSRLTDEQIRCGFRGFDGNAGLAKGQTAWQVWRNAAIWAQVMLGIPAPTGSAAPEAE